MTTPRSTNIRADVAPYLEAVEEALRSTFDSLAETLPATLLQIGKQALAMPGKVMAEAFAQVAGDVDPTTLPLPRWPLYVILSYQAALPAEERDTWRKAIPAAIALEIAIAATDVLDELADADPSPIIRLYGPGQAMNTANLMLVVAQQILLNRGIEPGGERALHALAALLEVGLRAGMGQHLDMLYAKQGPQDVTLEMSAHVTSLKAGALISGACRMGALMAGAQGEVLELLTRFGGELGAIAQIMNDIQDVLPDAANESAGAPSSRKTDLLHRKRTLPIVFTLRDESPDPNTLQRAYAGEKGPFEEETLSQAVIDAGGVQFAQLVMEVHRQNALQTIEELETLRPGAGNMLAPIFSIEENEES